MSVFQRIWNNVLPEEFDVSISGDFSLVEGENEPENLGELLQPGEPIRDSQNDIPVLFGLALKMHEFQEKYYNFRFSQPGSN